MAPVHIHPTVFHDMRRAIALEERTGQTIMFHEGGRAYLERVDQRINEEQVRHIMANLAAFVCEPTGFADALTDEQGPGAA